MNLLGRFLKVLKFIMYSTNYSYYCFRIARYNLFIHLSLTRQKVNGLTSVASS